MGSPVFRLALLNIVFFETEHSHTPLYSGIESVLCFVFCLFNINKNINNIGNRASMYPGMSNITFTTAVWQYLNHLEEMVS